MVPGMISLLVFTNNYPLGFLFILFFIYMIFMAYRQNNEYWTALNNESLLEKKTETLKKLSNRDDLTGLYNRRYFNQAFSYEWKRAIRKNTSVVILICDVDYFKKVNDQYGHIAGDEYLKMTTSFLQQVFRRDTDIVARYGGEEFVILMPEETIEAARNQAEKVRQLVEFNPLEFGGHSILTTISIGLANMVPEPDLEKELLLSKADKALYMAKTKGRNRVCINFPD
jgi:diguanylate cyclase (GGDEF)-like protein